MSRVVRRSFRRAVVRYEHRFEYADLPGAGYAFEVTEAGALAKASELIEAKYRACLAGIVDGSAVVDLGVHRSESVLLEPGVVRCDCGAEVVVWPSVVDAHECGACGRLFNGGGQELRPMSEWPEIEAGAGYGGGW